MIYVLSDYDGVLGVFSSAELAAEAQRRLGCEFSAEAMQLDEMPPLHPDGYSFLWQFDPQNTKDVSPTFSSAAPDIWRNANGTFTIVVRAHNKDAAAEKIRGIILRLRCGDTVAEIKPI